MALCCPALLSLQWNRSYSAVSGVAELLRDGGRFAPRHWTNWSEKRSQGLHSPALTGFAIVITSLINSFEPDTISIVPKVILQMSQTTIL